MTDSKDLCPCGSQQPYSVCCEPIHQSPLNARHPEQLMRSRYSAHVKGLVDYVVDTYHPSCNAGNYREAIAESVHGDWRMLEVLNSSVEPNGKLGYVEFKAWYMENGKLTQMHEKSRFLREPVENGEQWYYVDGEHPKAEKVSRNDPCPCGSGKKFKKCCG